MTGKEYEKYVSSILKKFSKYIVKEQVRVGEKRWGGGRIVDLTLDNEYIVSLKHQESAGSIDEKNIAEVIDLDHAVQDYGYKKAILVLSDPNNVMRTKNFLKSKRNLKNLGVSNVEVVTHDTFVRKFVGTLRRD